MTDDIDIRRRRTLYRATHRGTKEMDVMVGRYAEAMLPKLDIPALDLFEELIALPDPILQGWLLNQENTAESAFAGLIAEMRCFHGLDTETPAAPEASRE